MGMDVRFEHRFKCEHCNRNITRELSYLGKRNPVYHWVLDQCFYKNKNIVSEYGDSIIKVEMSLDILEEMFAWVEDSELYADELCDGYRGITLGKISTAILKSRDGDTIIFQADW